MWWILLALLAGLGDATIYALMKHLRQMSGLLVVWIQYAFSLPFLYLLLVWFYPDTIQNQVWWLGVANAILLVIGMLLLFRAFKAANLSLTVPLLSLTPLFLLVTSTLMLGQAPVFPWGYGGVLLVVVGTYVLNMGDSKGDWLGPFKALFTNVGPRCALGMAIIMSVMANMFKLGQDASNPFFYSAYVHTVATLLLLPVVVFKAKEYWSQLREKPVIVGMLGFSSAFMTITAGLALLTAIVPYMISLKRSSVLWGMLYSHFLFKEQNIKGRLFGAGIMLAGAVMIVLS